MGAKEQLAVLKERLEMYRRAEAAILSSQEYEMDGVRLKRADLAGVQKMVSSLERQVARLSGRRSRLRQVVPRDW